MRALWLILLLSGCNRDQPGFVITGALAEDYHTAARGFTDDLEPDQIAAIPHIRGVAGNWADVVTAEVAAGQDFELVLEPSYDHILVLLDTQSGPESQLVSVFEMPSDTDRHTLTDLASSNGEGQDIDVGEVRSLDDETAQAETVMETVADAFGLDEDQLQQLALTDDSFRGIASQYLNADSATGDSWWAALGYGFHQPLANALDARPEDYDYGGPHVSFNTNVDGVVALADTLCDGTRALTITPPGPVTLANSVSYGPDTPATNQGITVRDPSACSTPDGGLSIQWSDDMIWFDLSQSPVVDNAEGWWVLAIDDEEQADFALSLSDPINAQGIPTLPIPTPVLTADGARITSVSIQWSFAGPDGTLQPMEPRVAEQLIYGSRLILESAGPDTVYEMSEGQTGDQSPLAPNLTALQHDWTLDASGTPLFRLQIYIDYAGQGATFEFSD